MTHVQSVNTFMQDTLTSSLSKDENTQPQIHELDMGSDSWKDEFRALFDRAVEKFSQGTRSPLGLFTQEEQEFLNTLGANPQEIFDFVEDWVEDKAPDLETVVRITAIRRAYFLQEQNGQFSGQTIHTANLPSPSTPLAGLPWFPRIIEKAQAKLRGELPPDLMYSCGGDRRFLSKVQINPADFLEEVWKAGEDTDRLIRFVTKTSSTNPS